MYDGRPRPSKKRIITLPKQFCSSLLVTVHDSRHQASLFASDHVEHAQTLFAELAIEEAVVDGLGKVRRVDPVG